MKFLVTYHEVKHNDAITKSFRQQMDRKRKHEDTDNTEPISKRRRLNTDTTLYVSKDDKSTDTEIAKKHNNDKQCDYGITCRYWQRGTCYYDHSTQKMQCKVCGGDHPKFKCTNHTPPTDANDKSTKKEDEASPFKRYNPSKTINNNDSLDQMEASRVIALASMKSNPQLPDGDRQ
eukprot:399874_1